MSTLHQQIKELEKSADLLRILRDHAKGDGGRLTTFGKDFVHACANSNISQSSVAKILDVTASAISQHYSKLKTD